MSTEAKTMEQIRQAGLEALVRELGPVGAVRFLQLSENGSGDYSQERYRYFGEISIEEIAGKIKKEDGK